MSASDAFCNQAYYALENNIVLDQPQCDGGINSILTSDHAIVTFG